LEGENKVERVRGAQKRLGRYGTLARLLYEREEDARSLEARIEMSGIKGFVTKTLLDRGGDDAAN